MYPQILSKIVRDTRYFRLNRECYQRNDLFFYRIKNINELFEEVCIKGYVGAVKLLLNIPKVDPSYFWNQAIIFAAQCGHLEVVKLLMADSRVDPSYCVNEAFKRASRNGHLEVVKLLETDERVRKKM